MSSSIIRIAFGLKHIFGAIPTEVDVVWSTARGNRTSKYTGTYTHDELSQFLTDLMAIGFTVQYVGDGTVRLQKTSPLQTTLVAIRLTAEARI